MKKRRKCEKWTKIKINRITNIHFCAKNGKDQVGRKSLFNFFPYFLFKYKNMPKYEWTQGTYSAKRNMCHQNCIQIHKIQQQQQRIKKMEIKKHKMPKQCTI